MYFSIFEVVKLYIDINQAFTRVGNLGRGWSCAILMVLAFVLYGNTLGHKYAQDDAIVIYDNMYTTQGLDGIKGHLTKDTFFGFFKKEGKAKLVSGGRYRPFTPIMFCLEYAVFGDNPTVGHFFNVLWYGSLCCMIYLLLSLLLAGQIAGSTLLALIVSILFLTHPIHTEAVANIKGRDEIISMLSAVSAFYLALRYSDKSKIITLGACLIAFFIGLMSKENTITYLAVIPVGLMLFRKSSGRWISIMGAVLAATAIFLVIRTQILGFDLGGKPMELMNNPFLKWNGSEYIHYTILEKASSILVSLGNYLWLMLFPLNLSHDYYPGSVELVSLVHWKPMLSLLVHLGLIGVAIKLIKKKPVVSFGIFYYFATLSIVSNIVFPIGTHMSERFLFMPSLGLILAAVGYLWSIRSEKNSTVLLVLFAAATIAYSARTMTRNVVWYDDYTLFTNDVGPNTKSAKLLNAAGGILINRYFKETDKTLQASKVNEAVGYLNRAVEVHPTYTSAYHILGTGHNIVGNFDASIAAFDKALSLNPGYGSAMENLLITLQEAGKHYGQSGNIAKSIPYLTRAEEIEPDNAETNRLLGIAYGTQGNNALALKYFQKVRDALPNVASSYVNLGIAYQNNGDDATAKVMLEKAVELDPNALNNLKRQ